MAIISAELASVASYASKNQFDRLVKDLILYWKNGEEVGLAELNESESNNYFIACSSHFICT